METAGTLPATAGLVPAERDHPRFNVPNVLWFFAGFAIAIAADAVIGFAVAKLIGVWPSKPFADPFQDTEGAPFAIDLVTIAVALAAFWLTRFAFLLFDVVVAILLTTQFLLAAIVSDPSDDDRAVTAIVVGLALVAIGLVLDGAVRRRAAFWWHVGGLFAVAVALSYYAVQGERKGWIPMLVAGAVVVLLAAPLRRATWAAFGRWASMHR